MRGRRAIGAALHAALAATCFHFVAEANPVMSWVPAYETKGSADALRTNLGEGRTVAQTLSRIAFQFWRPVEEGLALDKRVSEAGVRQLAALARQDNVQVLLGVFNAYTDVGGSGFSWDRAKKLFADKRSAFVQQIVAEMEKFGLDGVEIDIESEGDGLSDQDSADYAAFIIALAEEVHSRGKNHHPEYISWTVVRPEQYLVERLG
jgi:Glycosyl hydrolases family 18